MSSLPHPPVPFLLATCGSPTFSKHFVQGLSVSSCEQLHSLTFGISMDFHSFSDSLSLFAASKMFTRTCKTSARSIRRLDTLETLGSQRRRRLPGKNPLRASPHDKAIPPLTNCLMFSVFDLPFTQQWFLADTLGRRSLLLVLDSDRGSAWMPSVRAQQPPPISSDLRKTPGYIQQ